MPNITHTFSSFSVDDLDAAKQFYGSTLGFTVGDPHNMGVLDITLPGGAEAMAYPKPDHVAATFTVLNLVVEDIDGAVEELAGKGVVFEHYEGEYMNMDDNNISRSPEGQAMAWFKDPAGNILSILSMGKSAE